MEWRVAGWAAALLACAIGLLGGCGDGAAAPPVSRTTTVAGYVVDGPLEGARVRVHGAGGALLGETVTGVNGYYGVIVTGAPPLRVVAEGGAVHGRPYAGSLRADCLTAAAPCDITPWTTATAQLVDAKGFNAVAARALMASRVGEADPFLAGLPGRPRAAGFDLDAARAFLRGGEGLQAWVNAVARWVVEPSRPVPAGIRERRPAPTARSG